MSSVLSVDVKRHGEVKLIRTKSSPILAFFEFVVRLIAVPFLPFL